METANYNLPEFTADDTADLIGVYNKAIETIDTKLKESSEDISANTVNIDTLNSNIDVLNKNVLVWIGDSFSDPDTVPLDWVPMVANGIHAELHSYAKSGAGFSSGLSFNTQLQNAIDDTSFDNKYVKNIVLYGGNNDIFKFINGTYTNLYTDATTFVKKIKNNFPNAKVHIAVCNVTGNVRLSIERIYLNNIKAVFAEQNLAFDCVPNVDQWQNMYSDSYLSSTNEHPSANMCYRLIELFSSVLSGESGSTLSFTYSVPVTNVHKGVVDKSSVIGNSAGILPFFIVIVPKEAIPAGETIITIGNSKQLYNKYNKYVYFANNALTFYFDGSGNLKCYQNIPASTSAFVIDFPSITWRNI